MSDINQRVPYIPQHSRISLTIRWFSVITGHSLERGTRPLHRNCREILQPQLTVLFPDKFTNECFDINLRMKVK